MVTQKNIYDYWAFWQKQQLKNSYFKHLQTTVSAPILIYYYTQDFVEYLVTDSRIM